LRYIWSRVIINSNGLEVNTFCENMLYRKRRVTRYTQWLRMLTNRMNWATAWVKKHAILVVGILWQMLAGFPASMPCKPVNVGAIYIQPVFVWTKTDHEPIINSIWRQGTENEKRSWMAWDGSTREIILCKTTVTITWHAAESDRYDNTTESIVDEWVHRNDSNCLCEIIWMLRNAHWGVYQISATYARIQHNSTSNSTNHCSTSLLLTMSYTAEWHNV